MDSTTSTSIVCAEIRRRLKSHGFEVKQEEPRRATLRRASILVLLANDGKILLTQRSLHLRSHPGEVCFPGGKQDEGDQGDDWTTALRETLEEVGLEFPQEAKSLASSDSSSSLLSPLPPLERLSRLGTLESMNQLCVTPVVGFVDASSEQISKRIHINSSEVKLFFWAPLHFFLSTQPVQEYDIEWRGGVFVFRKYIFPLNDHDADWNSDDAKKGIPITGLTAHIAREVAEIALLAASSPTLKAPIPTEQRQVQEYRGLLWKLQDGAFGSTVTRNGTKKNGETKVWSRQYFILSGGMLHQYDNRQMAEQKSQSASKKNRLKLINDGSICIQDYLVGSDTSNGTTETVSPNESSAPRYAFRVYVSDGRIIWHLAAASPQERSQWKSRLFQSANTIVEDGKS